MSAPARTAEQLLYYERARCVEAEKRLAEKTAALDERDRQFENQSKLLKALEIAYEPGSKAAQKRAACNLVNCGISSNNRTNISRWIAKVWEFLKELDPDLKLKENYTVTVRGSICERLSRITTTPEGNHPIAYYFTSILPMAYDLIETRRNNVTAAIKSSYECELINYLLHRVPTILPSSDRKKW